MKRQARDAFLMSALLGAALAASLILTGCQSSTAEESQAAASSPSPAELALAQGRQQLETQKSELAAREQELTQQAAELARSNEQLEAQKAELEQRASQVAARDRQLQSRLEELDTRMQALEEREAEQRAAAEPPPAPRPVVEPPPRPPIEPPRPSYVDVPAGTPVEIEFVDRLSSRDSREGDTFRTRIVSDVVAEGRVAIPAGSEILGVVTEAVPLQKKIGSQARLAVRFTHLVPIGGGAVPIEASYTAEGRNEKKRDAATVGGAAAGGAVLGRVLDDKDRGRGTLIGAILGAAAGAAIASQTGQELEIPDGTWAKLTLETPVRIERR